MSGKPGKAEPTYTAAFRADAVRLVAESGKRLRHVPRTAGAQDEDDRVDGAAVADAAAITAEWMRLARRRLRLYPLPEDIRHPPMPHRTHATRPLARIHRRPPRVLLHLPGRSIGTQMG